MLHIDGHDHAQIAKALDEAVTEHERPFLILARTHIGNGAPHKHDTHKVHGEPLGDEETKATKEALGWPLDKPFFVPDEVHALWDKRAAELGSARASGARTRRELARRARRRGRDSIARCARSACPADLLAAARRRGAGQDRRDAQPGGRRSSRGRRRWCRRWSAATPTSAARRRRRSRTRPRSSAGEFDGPQPALRHPRARDGRHRQRHRALRHVHPVHGDVPDLQRLHAAGDPPGGAVARCR